MLSATAGRANDYRAFHSDTPGRLTAVGGYWTSDAGMLRQRVGGSEAVVKNAIWAWVTILLMGMGTAATASWSVNADRAESAQALAARGKRPRVVRAIVP